MTTNRTAESAARSATIARLEARLQSLPPNKRALVELKLDELRRASNPRPETHRAIERLDENRVRFPLSFSQERLWLVDQIDPGSSAYNLFDSRRLVGSLHVHALARALLEIERRHHSLRTAIEVEEGVPCQVVVPLRANCALPLVDLSGTTAEVAERKVVELAATYAAKPFDLARAPQVRSLLVRLAPQDHGLLTTVHHIVSDGWSLGLFLAELLALYQSFRTGRPSPLPALSIQYGDFSLWQRSRFDDAVLDGETEYWRQRLAGLPDALELPVDRPRPVVQTFGGSQCVAVLDLSLTSALRQLAAQRKTTFFTLMLTLFGSLLARWSGQDDLAVGSPIAGRDRAETEPLIGFFVNTLVLRLDISEDPTFQELLDRSSSNVLEDLSHNAVPFERLVAELSPRRNMSRSPLFQVMFALQNAMSTQGALQGPLGLTVSPLRLGRTTSKYELTLEIHELPHGSATALEYNTDLFDRTTMVRLLRHLAVLARSVVRQPDVPISRLPWLTPGEVHALRCELAGDRRPYPSWATLPSLFAERVSAASEEMAVLDGETSLSYRELDRLSNRLAHRLVGLGVLPDEAVGIFARRGIAFIVGLLAITKAGGAYVPLDPEYPEDRLRIMARTAGLSLCLAGSAELARELGEIGAVESGRTILLLDELDPEGMPDEEPPGVALHPLNRAYVVFTSGSTGVPKGISIPHRGVLRLVRGNEFLQCKGGDRIGHLSNTSFDAATFEVWAALLNGGGIVVISRDDMLLPQRLGERLDQQRVNRLFVTTVLFNEVARQLPEAFDGLDTLLFGGEAVDPQWARLISDRFRDRAMTLRAGAEEPRLLHVYGPTESTTFATWHHVDGVDAAARTVPIGRALSNTTSYVIDSAGYAAALGAAGELWLGGDGLARGYVSSPALTAAAFVPNPFRGEGARLYRTGDLVRRRFDGAIEFLGRIDHQVKVRGFRIELGEIEAVLSGLPAIEQAAVLGRPDITGALRLVAYCVVAPGQETTPSALRKQLGETLPEYMVPRAFQFLPEFPRTKTGKVDRNQLPDPEGGVASQETVYVAPRNEIEEAIVQIWEEILQVERIGIHHDFFELGGHSLLATQVVARINAISPVQLSVVQLFNGPTVAQLSEALGEVAPEEGQADLSDLFDDIESMSEEDIEAELRSRREGVS